MGCTSTTAYLTIHNMVSWMLGSWLPAEVAEGGCQGLPAANCWAPTASPSRAPDPMPRPSRPAPCAMARLPSRRQQGVHLGRWQHRRAGGDGPHRWRGGEGSPPSWYRPRPRRELWQGGRRWAGTASRPGGELQRRAHSRPLPAGAGGEGFKFAMQALDGGRINIATCSVGTAQQALTMRWPMCSSASNLATRSANFRACSSVWPTWPPNWRLPGCWCARLPPGSMPGARQECLVRHGQAFCHRRGSPHL